MRSKLGLALGAVLLYAGCFCGRPLSGPPARVRAGRAQVRAALEDLDSDSGLYRAVTNIKVRLAPDINAPSLAGAESAKLKSGEWVSVIKEGEVFQASEMKTRDGQVYLKLADQDGWVFGRGISGEWAGRNIVTPIPDSEALGAKATIVGNLMERQLIRDSSDKFALYFVGGALLLVLIERIWEEFA